MALTLTILEQANTLKDEVDALDAQIAKLDTLKELWEDMPNDRYVTSVQFKNQEVNGTTVVTEIQGTEDTATTLIEMLEVARTYLQSERDSKWAEFQALCPEVI